ncbi:MAG: hypothetical protein GY794_06995, partial [bacterium]|nr:hypothetical protein [bacterium]
LRRTSQLNNDIQASNIRSENLTASRDRLTARAAELTEMLDGLQSERSEMQGKVSSARSSVETGQARLDKADENCQKLSGHEQELRVKLADSREQRSATASRITALTEMQERLEGVSAGVRLVLKAVGDGNLPVIRGMLGDCISTDIEHAPVVEAALAGADQWLVADEFEQLRACGDRINGIIGQSGAVEIVSLDRVSASRRDFDLNGQSLIIAPVIDWVRYEASLEPVISSILGRTMVVSTLADATAAAAADGNGNLRFVTLNGEVLEPDGRIRMGAANRSTGVIARKSELASLEVAQSQLDDQIGQLELQCRDAHDEIKQLDAHREALRAEINEANTTRVRLEANLAQLDEQIDQAQREQPVIAEDIKGLGQDIASAQQQHQQASEELARLKQISLSKEQASVRIETEIATATERQGTLASRLTELRVAIASSEQKRLALRDSLAGLNRQCEQMKKDLASGKDEIELIRGRRGDTEQAVQAAREETDQLYTRQQELNVEAVDLEETRQGLKEKHESVRQGLTDQRRVHDETAEAISSHRVKLGQVDTNIENLITRSHDDLAMDLVAAFGDYQHDDQRQWDEVRVRIEELTVKIQRLGNVNLDAIGEQEELEKRQQFLSTQLKDIAESRSQLNDLILRINSESHELFVQTFELVRENFQELFRKLFGGGRADIM